MITDHINYKFIQTSHDKDVVSDSILNFWLNFKMEAKLHVWFHSPVFKNPT